MISNVMLKKKEKSQKEAGYYLEKYLQSIQTVFEKMTTSHLGKTLKVYITLSLSVFNHCIDKCWRVEQIEENIAMEVGSAEI